MEVLECMQDYGHEEIVFARDEQTGLRAIIAIHDTTLGPAVGGTRFWPYRNEDDALRDVLRLSRGMSLKNAAAGLQLGGGKAVILGDPKRLKTPELLYAYGRFVDGLGGRYYTAEDVNTSADDIARIREVTPYVTGTPAISGNPSPYTARGVYRGMKAGLQWRFGSDKLENVTVAVQGVGSVGHALCALLHQEGARLKVYDLDRGRAKAAATDFDAQILGAEELLTTKCDVLAPCALGGVLGSRNVQQLSCAMVCGAANNILEDAGVADALAGRGILYLPDFIVNAGGVINCGEEITAPRYDAELVREKVDAIYDTTLRILRLAEERRLNPNAAAETYALDILQSHTAA